MSPGFLKIVHPEYGSIMLYTFHSEMNIPDAVKKAPVLLAKNYYYINTRERVERAFQRDGNLSDRLFYHSCVAALVIAAEPFLLEPIVAEEQMKKRRGYDDPYILTLNVDERNWIFTNKIYNEETDEVDLVDETIDCIELFTLACLENPPLDD